jgi:hypothetical protein
VREHTNGVVPNSGIVPVGNKGEGAFYLLSDKSFGILGSRVSHVNSYLIQGEGI